MTPREQAAFNAGIEAVRQMAMVAAVTIEVRDDAGRVQHQAAVAALQGLADGAGLLMLEPSGGTDHCIAVDLNNETGAETGRGTRP